MTVSGPLAQCAAAVLMVRPAAFGMNAETVASNAFQATLPATDADRDRALAEFDGLVRALCHAGVEVIVAADTPVPARPDACFPNNWLSLHHDGTVVLYPMLSPLRRLERRREVIDTLVEHGYAVRRTHDRTTAETRGRFLEGTGSIVFDHRARIAYACLSPRTHVDELATLAAHFGYRAQPFHASGPAGEPIYHTNVVMSVGEGFAVLCAEAIDDAGERERICRSLMETGHEFVLLSRPQMGAFAGNLLQLATGVGGRVIALSATALDAFDAGQRGLLERHGRVVAVPVPTIERFGGGSVRCMLAEVFLPASGVRRVGETPVHATGAGLP